MRYALSFLLAIVALTVVAVLSFRHISEGTLAVQPESGFRLGADTLTRIRRDPALLVGLLERARGTQPVH